MFLKPLAGPAKKQARTPKHPRHNPQKSTVFTPTPSKRNFIMKKLIAPQDSLW
ncbi:hypothetical protein A11S_1821 [Micavibrio aeruginosavorus EPB]|uniref:Uncharacterized protein n=1 Tax=Micavibrio aeruginosavorus EPB TaxID=349215 RepID=M4VHE3_9BACT|nr:hypothetical protein A11S_1821 [Micavibrio aeruginosavorus EPB]